MKYHKVSIIGGGIAGLTTAIALQNIGIDAHIFEASQQMEPLGAGLGLGINAMMANLLLDGLC
ncbi:MAG: NAD(P)-binding protein [Saprospiraceae bacterium]